MRSELSLAVLSAAAVAAAGALGVSAARGDVISFQNGASNAYVSNYAGTSDTTFDSAYDAGGGYSGGNWGGRDFIDANQSRTWEELEALVRFDLSVLNGKGLTVNSATLKLAELSGGGYDNVTVNLYPIAPANAAWQQGTGTNLAAPAATGEATWDHLAAPSTNWAGSAGLETSGTDYDPTVAGTGIYNNSDASGTIVSFTLPTNLVQGWIDAPSNNAGLVMRTDYDSVNYNRFAEFGSSENATAAWRPELALDVSAVPEPASLFLLAGAPVLLGLRRRGRA